MKKKSNVQTWQRYPAILINHLRRKKFLSTLPELKVFVEISEAIHTCMLLNTLLNYVVKLGMELVDAL